MHLKLPVGAEKHIIALHKEDGWIGIYSIFPAQEVELPVQTRIESNDMESSFFEDYCMDCPMYKGNLEGRSTDEDEDEERGCPGGFAIIYENDCQKYDYGTIEEIYYETEEELGYITVSLPRHAFVSYHEWYEEFDNQNHSVKENGIIAVDNESELSNMQGIPLRLGNVHGQESLSELGKICWSYAAPENNYDSNENYKRFFASRFNSDLVPASIEIGEWLRDWSIDEVENYEDWEYLFACADEVFETDNSLVTGVVAQSSQKFGTVIGWTGEVNGVYLTENLLKPNQFYQVESHYRYCAGPTNRLSKKELKAILQPKPELQSSN